MVYEGYRSTVLMEADFLTEIKKKKKQLRNYSLFLFLIFIVWFFFCFPDLPLEVKFLWFCFH